MKKALLAIVFLVSGTAFASTGAESIYNALNVQEEAMSAPRTQLKYQKSVGGLTCIKINDIRSGDSFSCSLTLSQADTVAIYSALNVEEGTLPAVRTELKYKKSVGGLSCVKTNHIAKGDSVDCSLSL